MLIYFLCFQLMTFPSSNVRYPYPDCGKAFRDPPALIQHRKKDHSYRPHHTPRYVAKQALKAKQKSGKALSNNTRDQPPHDNASSSAATSTVSNILKKAEQKSGKALSDNTCDQPPHDNASSPAATSTLSNILKNETYHDDFWKLIVDVPRHHVSELKDTQDVQISVPVAAAPACDAPKSLHSDSDLSSLEVGQSQPFATQTHDEAYLLGPQLDTIVQPQSQTLAQLWTENGHTIPAASDHHPFTAPFPMSEEQSLYPGMGFPSLPLFSYTNVPSSMPNLFTFPTTSTVPSSLGHQRQFVPLNHMATPPLELVPGLSWTPTLSPANPTPLSQPTSEPDNSWCQSRNFA
jgi:hypothetical protein